ncbi:MAG: serine--tRNA ligase [Alphaproteobacteria bacterium]|nr:serine--tRNA ligase [Alphaproteobacteria bacterium]
MHDIKAIREDASAFIAGLNRRGLDGAGIAAELLARDAALRTLLMDLQAKQARRNDASKAIGKAKQARDEALAATLMDEVAGLKTAIQRGEELERQLESALRAELAKWPNLPAVEVPDGVDETANVAVAARAFEPAGVLPAAGLARPREHFELGELLGMMDFERAAKVSGSRFVYLTRHLARLERALANFMLDLHTEHFGYCETSTPLMVRDEAMFGTGQLPKFAEDLFATARDGAMAEHYRDLGRAEARGEDTAQIPFPSDLRLWLIPTAEVTLTNYLGGEILDEAQLPYRFTAHTPCFRSEAGAAGRDTRGMIRMHQFAKVELVSITTPEQSAAEHERMTDAAQEVLKRLELKHRVVTLCTGDMGFAATKTYDIEVWLCGQGRYREISSCSNCGDFQARRMNMRYRPAASKTTRFVHTLNGSGLAVGRALVAIVENYQNADGSIEIPAALKPYMGGLARIDRAD